MRDSLRLNRVLMTTDTVGGVWDYSLQLAEGLSARGTAVMLATMGPLATADQAEGAAQVPGLELVSRECRLEWMDDPWADVATAGEWLLDVEATFGPDLVHLNGYAHGSLPWRAPAVVVGHSCVYSWWVAVRGGLPPSSWTIYQDKVRTGLAAADVVAAPTRAMAAALAEHYGCRNARVIPNGRDARYYSPGPKGPFVLCAGRVWDEAKNVALLVSAARRLPWPVYVAGQTVNQERMWDASRVHVLGRLPSSVLRHWLACAAIYALPAKYEPFGLSALEAALCGCALVLGDIPSLRENWDGAAVFVSTDDPEALTFCIRSLTRSPKELNRLAGLARARAQELSVDRMVDGYMDLYTSVTPAPLPVRTPRTASCAS
jgi:glycosyltransferase involved in cell wall biosynthesis